MCKHPEVFALIVILAGLNFIQRGQRVQRAVAEKIVKIELVSQRYQVRASNPFAACGKVR